jgi:Fe-S cluster biogenesis protein NfuA
MMSIRFVSSPNPLAATFDLGQDYIDGFGKIVVPKNDPVADHAPVANHFFELITPLARVDLANQGGHTLLTVNLGGFMTKVNPDFKWDDKRKSFIAGKITEFLNDNGKIILPSLRQFPTTSPFIPQDNDVTALVDAFESIARPLAHKHGGDYELVDFEASSGFFGKQEKVTATIAVFGACAGCSSFDQTFGKAPQDINSKLEKIGSPYRMKKIQPSPNKGALIFARR